MIYHQPETHEGSIESRLRWRNQSVKVAVLTIASEVSTVKQTCQHSFSLPALIHHAALTHSALEEQHLAQSIIAHI
jgi:hypothetical protein